MPLDPDHGRRQGVEGRLVTAADAPPMLFHGTSGARAQAICNEGLRPACDHVFLTDSVAMAHGFAEYVAVADHVLPRTGRSIADDVTDLDGLRSTAALLYVVLPAEWPLVEQTVAPFMFAESDGRGRRTERWVEYVTDRAIPAEYVGRVSDWDVDQETVDWLLNWRVPRLQDYPAMMLGLRPLR